MWAKILIIVGIIIFAIVLGGIFFFVRTTSTATVRNVPTNAQPMITTLPTKQPQTLEDALGCTSQEDCLAYCKKAENRLRCRDVFRQLGIKNFFGEHSVTPMPQ